MWSKSVCVSQIQRRSAGSITDRRAAMNSSLCTTEPVSTSTGSSAWITKALMARLPKPLMALVDVTTSTSGAAL